MPTDRLQSRTSIEYLKDTFKIGYETYESSKIEARDMWDMYHNKMYTTDQLEILRLRGQPAETFNIIKLFSRLLIGYYSTVVNTIMAEPMGPEDIVTTSVINDLIDHALRDNNFIDEGDAIKLSGILTGLMGCYVTVEPTTKKDQFGRTINRINLEYVPESELVLDPASTKTDNSDSRFQHRYKWLTEEAILAEFGQAAMDQMVEFYNFTNQEGAEFNKTDNTSRDSLLRDRFSGVYRVHNSYLIIHSITVDEKGKSWSMYWHDDIMLRKDEITHRELKFPYRTVKIHDSEDYEYYGIYRDIAETQKAINQAVIKLQLMVSTQKAFVEDGAVEDLEDFTNAFNRVSAVIPVLSLQGIKIESLTREAMEQYAVIDKGFNRCQQVLGINDSFLGMAFASDSGRKVKLQNNQTIIALRYLTTKFESFYRLLGWDIANLLKQYKTATEVVRISDDMTGMRWLELNKPEEIWTGQVDQQGQPIMQYQFEAVLDPGSGEPMIDEEGNYVMAPIPTAESEIAFTNVDIAIKSTAYNDEDERNQLMLETVIQGPVGQMLSQVNPAGYFRVASLSIDSIKTKNAPEIAQIFKETSMMLGGNPEAEQEASGMAQGMPGQLSQQPKSEALKLPQNTNET